MHHLDSPFPDDELPTDDSAWAQMFLQQVASGELNELYSLDEFTDDQHRALSCVVYRGFNSRHATVRAAAAWITGELRFPTLASIEMLSVGFRDRSVRVRRACAWAAGKQPPFAAQFAPLLTAALSDPHDTVRFGALYSLERLGPPCFTAVPALLEVTCAKNELHRSMAADALSAIAPSDEKVKNRLREMLHDKDTAARRSATTGIGRSGTRDPGDVEKVVEMLTASDQCLRLLAVESLRKLGVPHTKAVEGLLSLLRSDNWYAIEPILGDETCRINVRSDLSESLERVLEPIEDETLDDFRRQFFDFAFREDDSRASGQAEALAAHDFFQKVQRARFGKPKNNADRQFLDGLLQEAQAKFANRLRSNPTLGLPSEKYTQLPKWIKVVSRSIASNLWRSVARERARAARQRETAHDPTLPDAKNEELMHLIFTENRAQLTQEERLVAGHLFLGQRSLASTAEVLRLTLTDVMALRESARSKIKLWLDQS